MAGHIHLRVNIVKRSQGHSAVAAAAYRARMEIVNERTGETWDYSRKADDVLFAGMFTPKGAPEWMSDRVLLWNGVERFETYKTAQVARNFTIALPHELPLEENKRLLTDFVRENFSRKGYVADAVIHKPDAGGDQRNVHAHVQVTMRPVEGDTFAAKKEQYNPNNPEAEQTTAWREAYAKTANRYLVKNGLEPRFDHRSYKDQGVDKTPTVHLGKEVSRMERDGVSTEQGDAQRAIKEANRLREEARTIEAGVANANTKARTRANDDAPQVAAPAAPPILSPTQTVIDRMKAEERAEQIEALRGLGRNGWQAMGDQMRGIFSALRSLTATMGGAILDIVKGSEFYGTRRPEPVRSEQQRQEPQRPEQQRPPVAQPVPTNKTAASQGRERDGVSSAIDRMKAERKAAQTLREIVPKPKKGKGHDYEQDG